MVPVRAFENQIFIAYVNNIGSDGAFDYAGLSIIAAPDGSALASAGLSEEFLTADIRASALRPFPERKHLSERPLGRAM